VAANSIEFVSGVTRTEHAVISPWPGTVTRPGTGWTVPELPLACRAPAGVDKVVANFTLAGAGLGVVNFA
jgi:hypothetical protein